MDDAARRAAELAAWPRQEHEMAIFLTGDSRVIVQGITGSEGTQARPPACSPRAPPSSAAPTRARPARPSTSAAPSVPVFGTVAEAMAATGADVSVVFVPPAGTKDAVIEADRRRDPAGDRHHRGHPGARHRVVLGVRLRARATPPGSSARTALAWPRPASPTPASSRPTSPAEGRIGLVSKSGTLTYQMMYELRDIGFSTAVGIGGDPIIGTTHIDCLQAFQDDPETDAIVMIGEIGGDAEERAAAYIEASVTKPVVAYVAGFTAPEGKTMGHAGAIISGSAGTAQAKKEALEKVGVQVGQTPSETARLVREIMRAR